MSQPRRSLRTFPGWARGLGSAREGTAHWWAQRLTAIALVPLTVWFVASLAALAGADHDAVTQWLASPLVAVLMVVLLVATFHHAQLGLQVVIEDYVHHEGLKTVGIVVVKFTALGLGLVSVFAALKVTLGG